MSIEDRIVSIQFDNKAFEKDIARTIQSLDNLRASLKFTEGIDFGPTLNGLSELSRASNDIDFSNAQMALVDLAQAGNSIDLSSMASSVENISSKFSAMGAVGFTVIQNLTTGVMDFVGRLASFGKTNVLDAIIGGGTKRSENIEQAKFMFRGLGIDVEAAMESAKQAVLGTAYGLGSASKAAAQFGASGIKVGNDMTAALRGVAGAAAMTGSSFEEIADIFAGSAGTGVVNTMDLMQFSTRGLNVAAAIAPVLKKTEAQVREMASSGQLDFKTFANAMDQAFGKHATKANELYSGSLANMRAALSRIGATIVTPKLEQQRDLFNALTPAIDKVHEAIKPVISAFIDWRRIGIDKAIGFIKNIDFTNFTEAMKILGFAVRDTFFAVSRVFAAIGVSFRDIFPKSSASTILTLAGAMTKFSHWLLVSADTIEDIRQIFSGFFAIIEIGWVVVKNVFRLFINIFSALAPAAGAGTGGLLSFAATVGHLAWELNKFLVEGGAINKFFEALAKVIVPPVRGFVKLIGIVVSFVKAFLGLENLKQIFEGPINAIKRFSAAMADAFNATVESDTVTNGVDRVSQRVEDAIGVWQSLLKVINYIQDSIAYAFERIGFYTQQMREKIANLWGPPDFKPALDAINTGLFGGLIYLFFRFMQRGLKLDFSGILNSISQSFQALTNHLKTLTLSVKVDLLKKIAITVAILTASMIALSMVDSAALTKSLAAMSTGMASLIGSLVLLDKGITNSKSAKFQNSTTAKLLGLSVVLNAMATAMLVLAGAMLILGKMSPEELARGMAGVTGGLASLVGVLVLLNKNTKTKVTGKYMKDSATAMLIIATALVALATAVKIFSLMSWETFADGFSRIALGLGLLVGALQLMPKNPHILAAAAAVGVLAFSLNLFASTIVLYNRIPWKTFITGIAKAAASIALIGLAMRAFPSQQYLISASVGMIAVGFALKLIADAIETLAVFKAGDLAKSVLALTAMLLALSVAVILFNSETGGAIAMVAVAGAVYVLASAIEKLGKMKGGDLAKGLGAIAVVMVLLAAALYGLGLVLPVLGALSLVMLAISGSVALFGGGVFFLAAGLALLARSGVKGAKAMVKVVKTFGIVAVSLVEMLGNVLMRVLDEIDEVMPRIVEVTANFLIRMLEEIIRMTPTIAEAIVEIIRAGFRLIREYVSEWIETGVFVLLEFLRGIRDNISEVTQTVIDIIVEFTNTLTRNVQRVIDAGTDLVLAIILGIGNAIDDIIAVGVWVLDQILVGFARGVLHIGERVTQVVVAILEAIADNSTRIATAGADFLIAFLDGIADNAERVGHAVRTFVRRILTAISEAIVGMTNDIAGVMVDFLNGMAEAIERAGPNIRRAAGRLAMAILDGLTGGLAGGAADLAGAGLRAGGNVISGIANAILPGSPSKVTTEFGKAMADGLALGLNQNGSKPVNSASNLADKTVEAFRKHLSKISTLADIGEINPVITPVLDLSKVKREASNLNGYLQASVRPGASLTAARIIATSTNEATSDTTPTESSPAEVKFEQNNYSPKALTTNDIYRNTKSQIALAKEELGIS